MFHILSGWNFLRKRKLLSRDRSAHTAKRMCPTGHCTTGESPRARTCAKVVISCSTFSNADHGYSITVTPQAQVLCYIITTLTQASAVFIQNNSFHQCLARHPVGNPWLLCSAQMAPIFKSNIVGTLVGLLDKYTVHALVVMNNDNVSVYFQINCSDRLLTYPCFIDKSDNAIALT